MFGTIFTCKAISPRLFFLIADSTSLLVIDLLDFLFLHDSVLVGCIFLEMYPFLLGYLNFWCIIVQSSFLTVSSISMMSVVISPLLFLILFT